MMPYPLLFPVLRDFEEVFGFFFAVEVEALFLVVFFFVESASAFTGSGWVLAVASSLGVTSWSGDEDPLSGAAMSTVDFTGAGGGGVSRLARIPSFFRARTSRGEPSRWRATSSDHFRGRI